MNNRRYRTDPAVLLAQGQAIMSSSEESRFLFRVFAVNMVLSGTPASKVGASAGFTKAAVTGWVKTADEQGFEALMPKGKSGRPSKLTDVQKEKIDEILQTDPEVSGYKVWDGPTLSTYIKETFGVDLGVRQCQRLFKELGYSQIRPQTFPSKDQDDSQAREEFKKNEKRSLPAEP
jgi:transposase